MTLYDLLSTATRLTFLVLAAITLVQALRRKTDVTTDVAIFFALPGAYILYAFARPLFPALSDPLVAHVALAAIFMMPYALLKVARSLVTIPVLLTRLSGLLMSLLVISAFFVPVTNTVFLIGLALYFGSLTIYAGFTFFQRAHVSRGVNSHRLYAAGLGAALLGLSFILSVLFNVLALPQDLRALSQIPGLLSGIAFYFGFTPPKAVWRLWQEPELNRFITGLSALREVRDTNTLIHKLQPLLEDVLGCRAILGLHDPRQNALLFDTLPGDLTHVPISSTLPSALCFKSQKPVLITDPIRQLPEHATYFQNVGVRTVFDVPLTVGDHRMGVLATYFTRPAPFMQYDLHVTQLLADQVASFLQSRFLVQELARAEANTEAIRLKEDFLSAAAHDLKTPLTTIVAQAQLLLRQARRDPSAPTPIASLERLDREARRLGDLVTELLDVSKLSNGRLSLVLEVNDIVPMLQATALRTRDTGRDIDLDAPATLSLTCDGLRIGQLIDNLVENACKYSPVDAPVRIDALLKDGQVHLSVSDEGIGIAPEEHANVFDRFQRGTNVDHRRYAGMGLGLYICKQVVEHHGGSIWVESQLGKGSTFHVTLPQNGPTPTDEGVSASTKATDAVAASASAEAGASANDDAPDKADTSG